MLSLKLGPGVDGFVSPFLKVADQRPHVVQRMKNISAAGNSRESFFVPGAKPPAEIGDVSIGSVALVDQFEQPDAPGIGVAMLFRTQQEAEGGLGIDPHQDRIAGLEDLIEKTDENAGEVVLLVGSRAGVTGLCTMLCTVPTESR